MYKGLEILGPLDFSSWATSVLDGGGAVYLAPSGDHSPKLRSLIMKSWIPAVLAIGLLLTVACSNSPSEPEGGEQFFVGQVAYQNPDVKIHTFIMPDTGIVRFEIVELKGMVGDLEPPEGFTVSVGFGLGFPIGDECRPTYQSTVVEGSDFSFQLTANEYCILLVDAGTLVEGMVVDYLVSLKGD
jgi:hypothetical protein